MKTFTHNCILIFLTWTYRGTPHFKKWLELEQHKEKILKATEDGDLPNCLLRFLSVAFWGIESKWFELADWERIISAFYVVLSKSPKVQLPITSPTDEKSKEESWDYDNRTWHVYSHILSKNYGWTLEYISRLHVVEALAKIQEIMVDEQLEREFYYGLSEVAYSYDKNTKKSKFVPMPRPHWMRPKMKEIKKVIIPASLLPVGVGHYDGIPDEYLPKETKSPQTLN